MITNFNSNSTIKINGGTGGSLAGGTVATITAAANEYIILSFSMNATTAGGGWKFSTGATYSGTQISQTSVVYIPPSSSVNITDNSGGTLVYSYVRFINSP